MTLSCFKAYDIRGKLGSELNEPIAYRIGRAFAQHLAARTVVVGGDVRLSTPALKQALSDGLRDAGADVLDIGLAGTEEIYFAAFHLDCDGAIEVTASHNPIDYNGMKLVGRGAKPISAESGLHAIAALAEAEAFAAVGRRGNWSQVSVLDAYIAHLAAYLDPDGLRPLRLVVNAGNGAAGHVVDALERYFEQARIPFSFIRLQHEPDGRFPHGIPNPLLPEHRAATSEAVLAAGADMGIAWDGDFDRCFLFDEQGQFIEGYYIVGLLAAAFLARHPGEKIIHDPRLIWNTIDIVQRAGGQAVQSRTGHAFIKERMRAENAIYGGEMSAHHYFRDFAYCDSGMIPWLLVAGLICRRQQPLSALVAASVAAFPCSGERNYQVASTDEAMTRVAEHFSAAALSQDTTDGLSLTFSNWRFNLRASNTEPLLRLNIESRGDPQLVWQRLAEIEQLIEPARR